MNGARVRFGAREHAWCLSANRWGARRAVRIYFRAVSQLGDGAFWVALVMAMVMVDGWRGLDTAARMAVVGAVATVLYRRLKQWTRRPRPFAQDQRIHAWIPPLDEYSFPSGHTLHAVSFSVVACAAYPALAWLLVPFTLSVAVSRVVLGVHYPSDVMAALAIGALLGLGVLWLL